jgi:hypothetical protein
MQLIRFNRYICVYLEVNFWRQGMPRVSRRKRRHNLTLGKYSKEFVMGLVLMGLAATIMALAGATANALQGYLAFNVTIGSSTVTVDVGFIPPVVMTFGGLLLFLHGFRKVARVRI